MNAYELGCTDEGLRKELTDMKESGVEIEAMQTYGGNTGLKSTIISQEVSHFTVSFVFHRHKLFHVLVRGCQQNLLSCIFPCCYLVHRAGL